MTFSINYYITVKKYYRYKLKMLSIIFRILKTYSAAAAVDP